MKKVPMFSDPSKLLDFSNWLYGLAAFLTLVATFGVIYFGRLVTKAKDVQVRQYQTAANTRIAEANARAAQANARAAEASANAAAATAAAGQAQERAELAKATAEKSALDKAQIEQDNLQLRMRLDQEEQARQGLEKSLAPRHLSAALQQQMILHFRAKAGRLHENTVQLTIAANPGNPESQRLAGEYAYVFDEIKWPFEFLQPLGGSLQGLLVTYKSGDFKAKAFANEIVSFSRQAGFQVADATVDNGLIATSGMIIGGDPTNGRVWLYVGAK